MTHHIVGFRKHIPDVIIDASAKFPVELGLLWPPNIFLRPGDHREFSILAGWCIR